MVRCQIVASRRQDSLLKAKGDQGVVRRGPVPSRRKFPLLQMWDPSENTHYETQSSCNMLVTLLKQDVGSSTIHQKSSWLARVPTKLVMLKCKARCGVSLAFNMHCTGCTFISCDNCNGFLSCMYIYLMYVLYISRYVLYISQYYST